MRKVYIEILPVMRNVDMDPGDHTIYEIMKGCRMRSEKPAWYPITMVMESTRDDDQEETVLVHIGTDSDQTKHNIEVLKNEMKEHGLSPTIQSICVSQEQDDAMAEDLIRQLIGIIRQGDDIYVSTTFGPKIMLMATLYGIQIVETGLDDVELQGIFYGEKTFHTVPPKYRLHDITSLYYIGQMIGSIKPSDEKQLQDVVDSLFSLGHGTNEDK